MSVPIISLSWIRKSYYLSNKIEIPVLKWIDLTIERGEFVALMGHSGSGKSTLLNVLGLLHPADDGIYELDGEDISLYRDDFSASYIRNRKLGFVFQLYYLIPRLNALENVMLPGIYAEQKEEDRYERAKYYLSKVWLGDKMYNKPSELSWGQQQRVSIARALINEPEIIFADEPTGALDATTTHEVMELIKSLNEDGTTVVMVTHETDVAAYAKRIIMLKDGKVQSHNHAIK
jgi:putative ABC transport system ATP-binding protein